MGKFKEYWPRPPVPHKTPENPVCNPVNSGTPKDAPEVRTSSKNKTSS